ncbi:uncharacterized protein [Solanum tuberosum]|nr:PREDICTED: uncharacterized protein LOC102587376 [Solanum tuberosum]
MIGKMRRTTSTTRITVDVMINGEGKPSDLDLGTNNGLYGHDHRHVSSKYHHRSSSYQGFHHHIEEKAHFLTTCGLCNHRLTPSRDIYMYRGDTAFCSMECREQQMKSDKRKEKLKLLVLKKKNENYQNYSELPFANSENSGKTKTIAAA